MPSTSVTLLCYPSFRWLLASIGGYEPGHKQCDGITRVLTGDEREQPERVPAQRRPVGGPHVGDRSHEHRQLVGVQLRGHHGLSVPVREPQQAAVPRRHQGYQVTSAGAPGVHRGFVFAVGWGRGGREDELHRRCPSSGPAAMAAAGVSIPGARRHGGGQQVVEEVAGRVRQMCVAAI